MSTETEIVNDKTVAADSMPVVDEPMPVGDVDINKEGVISEQEKIDVDESAPDSLLQSDLPDDQPAAVYGDAEEQLDEVEPEMPGTVDGASSADALAVYRHGEVLDTLVRHGNEQAVISEKLEQTLQKLAELSVSIELFSTTMNAMGNKIQKISEESAQMTSWSGTVKGVGTLSKLFQVAAIIVLVLLAGGMSYLAVRQHQAGHNLHQAEIAMTAAIDTQKKQIAEYDKHFAELIGVEIKLEREASSKALVQDKINRLRNGLAEQPLYRKNNGDWFIANGKSETVLSDPDLLEELNQAFSKAGRELTTNYLVPPHKVVVMLRPNGKGGTDIVVTKDTAP